MLLCTGQPLPQTKNGTLSKMPVVLWLKNPNLLDHSCLLCLCGTHCQGTTSYLPTGCESTCLRLFSPCCCGSGSSRHWWGEGGRKGGRWQLVCVSSHKNHITSGRLWALGIVGTIDGLCRWARHRLMTGHYYKSLLVFQPHATDCKKCTETSPSISEN